MTIRGPVGRRFPWRASPPDRIPQASTTTRIVQQLGGSFGTAVLAVIGQRGLDGGAEPAFTRAFLWTTVFRVVAAGAGLRLPARVAAAERPS